MKSLKFVFDCLEGKYEFNAQSDNNLVFSIDSTIETLESFEGELDVNKTKLFFDEIDLANIKKWQRRYDSNLTPIEDAVKWYVKYIEDDKEYVSEGEESYEPYEYNHLIEAIKLCDDKADYFMI